MGHINRARRFVYEASRAHRDGGLEPQTPVDPAAEPEADPAAEPEEGPEAIEDTAPPAP